MITDTELELRFATKTCLASGDTATPSGCIPTGIVATTDGGVVAMASTETVLAFPIGSDGDTDRLRSYGNRGDGRGSCGGVDHRDGVGTVCS